MNFLDNLVADTLVCSLCIAMVCYVVYLNRKHLFRNDVSPSVGTGLFILWLTITIYSALYCPHGGDNWRSGTSFYYPYIERGEENHFESFYFRTMDLVPYGYVLWRIFVWGILGASSYIVLSQKLRIDKHISTLACLTFALPELFYYQRAIAGYCLMYIALALYYSRKEQKTRGLKSYLLPICLIGIALIFHNAMPFYIFVLIVSILTPLNRTSFITVIALSFIASLSLSDYAIMFLESTMTDTYDVGMNYLNQEYENNRNIFGRLFVIVEKLPVWVLLLYSFYKHVFKGLYLSRLEQVLLVNAGLLVLVSIMFSKSNGVIEGKFYTASMLPFTLYLALFYQRYRGCKFCNMFVYLTLACLIITNGYAILTNTFYHID